MDGSKRIFLVARGPHGVYATDGFHSIGENGEYNHGLPTNEEREIILRDLRKHRECLLKELNDLQQVENILYGPKVK